MILRGLWLLARGRSDGIREFGNTLEAFTASLAPLIAFPLVGATLSALSGQWQAALVGFCARLCAVLVLPLIVYEFARATGRQNLWLRTATALDWSFWMLIPILFIAAFIAAMMVGMGLPFETGKYATLGMAAAWLLWYHWMIVRAGLEIGRVQAIVLVFVSDFAVGLFTIGPVLLHLAYSGNVAPI